MKVVPRGKSLTEGRKGCRGGSLGLVKGLRVLVCIGVLWASLGFLALGAGSKSNNIRPAKQRAWTVMVYIAADNDLEDYATGPAGEGGDINEMERIGSTNDVAIVVQLDTWTVAGGKRYYIEQDSDDNHITSPVIENLPELNTGDPNVLANFIKWASGNYPAQHYALVIWDHGAGWKRKPRQNIRGIAYDFTDGDYLTTIEMRQALEMGGVKFDFLGMDACLMNMVEVGMEIKDWANVICASEETIPGPGWPYDKFLGPLVQDPSMDAVQLGRVAVDAYINYYTGIVEGVTLSAVASSSLPDLTVRLNTLGDKLSHLYPSTNIDLAIALTQSFADEDFKDIFHFAQLIKQYVPEATNEADAVLNLKGNVVLSNGQIGMANAQGLSIYLPTQNYADYEQYYLPLIFAQNAPKWVTFLRRINGLICPFSFNKSVDKTTAYLGELLTYTLTLTHIGTQLAQDITITDVIPQNTEYVEGSASGNPTYDAQTKTLTWQIPSLDPGGSLSYYFKVKTIALGNVSNKATVTHEDFPLDSNVVTTNVQFPLSISKSVNKTSAFVGEELSYTISYRNTGTQPLQNITIIDKIPDNVEYIEGSATGDPTYDAQSRTLTWQIASIGANSSGRFFFRVKTLSEGDVTNKATLTYQDISIDSNITSTRVSLFPLSISKDSDKTSAFVNEPITFTIAFKNEGGEVLQNITITDKLPPEGEYIQGSATGNPTYDAQSRTLTWQITSLGANASGSVSFQLKPTTPATLVNKASITYKGYTVDSNSVIVDVSIFPLVLTKTVNRRIVGVGQELTYTISYKNIGSVTVQDAVISDIIPNNSDYIEGSATGDASYNAQTKTISWRIATLEPNSEGVFSFRAKVLDGTEISNKATVTYKGFSVDSNTVSTYVLAVGQEIPLCTDPSDQLYPSVYGDKVVWEDHRNGNADIYLLDLTTGEEMPICAEPHDQFSPVIYGDKVAWVDMRNGNPDIYLYDLSTGEERAICVAVGAQVNPAIYQDKVVWEDWRNGNGDIYMYDLTEGREIPICTEPHDQYGPKISGSKIVWMDKRNGNGDIFMYDLAVEGEMPICTEPHDQLSAAVFGGKVVWVDKRNGNGDIFMFDLSTGQEVPICVEPHEQYSPVIYGSTISWIDRRSGGYDIYLWEAERRETRISTSQAWKGHPSIWGDKLVWADKRNSNADIYLYILEKIDVQPPLVSILSPLSEGKICAPVPLIAEIKDPNLDEGSIKFFLDGIEIKPVYPIYLKQQFSANSGALSGGQHNLKVVARDAYGNQAEQGVSFQVASPQEYIPPPSANIVLIGLPFESTPQLRKIVPFEKACIWDGERYVLYDDPDFPQKLDHLAIWIKTSKPFNPSDVRPLGSSFPANEEISIPLHKGWNAFTLPWNYSLPLGGLLLEDKAGNKLLFPEAGALVSLILYRWDGNDYKPVGLQAGFENTLYPWFGYWIRAKDDCKFVFPKEPWKIKGQRASFPTQGFILPIKAVFTDGFSEEVYIGFGMQEIASPLPPPPPSASQQRRISLLKSDENLLVDIRKVGSRQEWQLIVKGDATLLFPNLSSLPKGWQVILQDGDKKYYLKTTSSVKVEGERQLRITIGEAITTPLLISSLDARPSRGGININWNVNIDCQTKVVIKGMDGKILRDFGARSSKAGLNSLFWDGRTQDGKALPAGIYIIELTARDSFNQMVRMIRGAMLR